MQLKQIGIAAVDNDDDLTWVVRYRSVGDEGVVNPSFVDPLCNEVGNMFCEYQGHINGGHEESTLQQMHNFCKDFC